MILASDIMTPNPVTVDPDTPVSEIARLMSDLKIGSVIVVDGRGDMVGIVTSFDIISKVVAEGKDPKITTAGDIMSKPVIFVEDSKPVSDVVQLMIKYGIRHVPVVNKEKKLVGIIAEFDIISMGPEIFEILEIYTEAMRERRKMSLRRQRR
ncbi:MAG: CBS domain-containing protein [Desulfurococcales archaeon]|jgi:CBS domain-containing protein|nr:CBS domain-containing protein [Desulfurococcales archaeon]MCC6061745.1 CBS domain-containing protein [Desulfurococcales archaeon]NAZ13483.1 CBS domain-containing protein [Desulfurococcales archaeon]